MDSERWRSVLIFVALVGNTGALVCQWRDRDRRERETRERPQPMVWTRAAKAWQSLGALALAGVLVSFFV